jgi:hypothetical protein
MMCEFGGVWKEDSVQPAVTPLPLDLYHPWWLIEHTLKYCKTTEYFPVTDREQQFKSLQPTTAQCLVTSHLKQKLGHKT